MSALLKRGGLHGRPWGLCRSVLYNVQFVATAPMAAMWLKKVLRAHR